MTSSQTRLALKIAGVCCLISGLLLTTVGGLYVMETVLAGTNMRLMQWVTLIVGLFNTCAAVAILLLAARHRKS